MNPQDPLANLHPLREPPVIGWWPPAPGWWFVAALALIAILAITWYFVRRYRANAYRRQALVQLAQLDALYQQERDETRFLAGTNALLKSVALVAYPRREVAASNGADWLAFLNGTARRGEQFPEELVTGAYRKNSPGIDVQRLRRSAESWIRRHEATR
ncbi:MAG: DUF4381 domain-containing protein [Pseudomonadales bacterium]|nr:DUF4381 domain-containing protein [Pseudomonadales bacterium]